MNLTVEITAKNRLQQAGKWRLEYQSAVTFVMQMTLITGLVQKQYVIIENCREEKCFVAGTYVDIYHGILLWSWSCWHSQSSHHNRIVCILGYWNQKNSEAPVLCMAPAHPPDDMESCPLKKERQQKDGTAINHVLLFINFSLRKCYGFFFFFFGIPHKISWAIITAVSVTDKHDL